MGLHINNFLECVMCMNIEIASIIIEICIVPEPATTSGTGLLLDRDTGKGWHSQLCPRAIGGINTFHNMIHSLSLPTVTYICMRELPHFHHGPTTSFLYSQPIQTPPGGPGFICAAGQVFIWDDPSVTPLS